MGCDVIIDYKKDDVRAKLASSVPEGCTHYFENVRFALYLCTTVNHFGCPTSECGRHMDVVVVTVVP